MKLFSSLTAICLLFVHAYGMSFDALCNHAYKASGEIIQTNGHLLSNTQEKASYLSGEPMIFQGNSSRIKGKNPIDSGMLYGGMLNFQFKKPALQEAKAQQYDQTTKILQQEIQQQEQQIQVGLKHDWLIAMLEQERINVLYEKAASAKAAHAVGIKKFNAGRMSQMELMRFQSEVRNADQELAIGEMELQHAQHGLQESTMLDETIVVDDLFFTFVSDDNRTESRINNARILQELNAQINLLDAQIKSARYEGGEFISMGTGATHEPTQNSINFTVSIPIVWSEKNERKIAALLSEKSALIHRRDVTQQKLQMNIHTLLEHLETREKRFKDAITAEKEQKKLMEMAQKGYEGGAVNQFEYLSTKNSYYDTRLRAIELKREYIQELSAMEEKLGSIWK